MGICSRAIWHKCLSKSFSNFMLDYFMQRGQNMSLTCCKQIFWHNTSGGKWTNWTYTKVFEKRQKEIDQIVPILLYPLLRCPSLNGCAREDLVSVWILVDFSWRCFCRRSSFVNIEDIEYVSPPLFSLRKYNPFYTSDCIVVWGHQPAPIALSVLVSYKHNVMQNEIFFDTN